MNTSKIKLVFLGAIGIVAVFVFTYIITTYVLKSRASGEVVAITTAIPSTQVPVGQTNSFTVILTAPVSKGIAGATLALKASNIKLTDIANATPMDPNNATKFDETLRIPSVDGATFSKTVTAFQQDANLPQIIGFNVSFTCKAAGPATIAFDPSTMEVIGNIADDTFTISGTDAVLQFSCTAGTGVITPTPIGPTINAHFIPQATSAVVGSTFKSNFILDGQPAGKNVSSFDVRISYDRSLVQVNSIGQMYNGGEAATQYSIPPPNTPVACKTDANCHICIDLAGTQCVDGFCNTGTNFCDFTSTGPIPTATPMPSLVIVPTIPIPTAVPTVGFPTQPPTNGGCTNNIADKGETTGIIRIVYLCSANSDQLPKSPTVPITFTAKAKGSGVLHVLLPDSTVAGTTDSGGFAVNATDGSYVITDTTSPTATPTPTTTGNAIKLNLKLKFQGIEKKPADPYNSFMVKCGISGGGITTPVQQTAEFKADDKGIWSGTLVYNNVQPGPGRKIFCKGPMHLQKRICNEKPTETAMGTYNPNCDKDSVTLTAGDNNLDFSRISMLVGDLPEQDGFANSRDMALVIINFDKSTSDAIIACDVNRDGICNAYDYSYMIGSFAYKLDEL